MAELPKYFYFRVTPVTNKGVLMQVIVEDASNADVVEVVRCKDCKNFIENPNDCISGYGLTGPEPMDFCPYGERRADNGN